MNKLKSAEHRFKLVREIVSEHGLLGVLPPEALAPPGALRAGLLRLEDEALGLDVVEEELADEVGVRRSGRLQAGPETVEEWGESRRNIINRAAADAARNDPQLLSDREVSSHLAAPILRLLSIVRLPGLPLFGHPIVSPSIFQTA